MGFFDKLKKINIFSSFGSELTDDFYDELEESLILADTGMDTTLELVEELRRRVKDEHIKTVEEARSCMCRCIADALNAGDVSLNLSTRPSVVLFIGVNGVGKTHNIGSLAARQALQYIDENYTRPIAVPEISRRFNVSPSYLSQCFKQEVGVSVKHYLIMRRMQQAKHLLLTTDEPVRAVALAVGYDDYRQFSKMFKSLTGVTPVQCRKGIMAQLAGEIPEAHFSLEI